MTRENGPTPRQVFGAMLRYHRERVGLSRADLACQVSKSVSLIQAIELGQRAATAADTEVAVRDSKDPNGPKLSFTPAAWRSFMTRSGAVSRP